MPVTAAFRPRHAERDGHRPETPEANLIASIGVVVATNTGLTSVTIDGLTSQLLG